MMARKQQQFSLETLLQPKGIILICLLVFWFVSTKERPQLKQFQTLKKELKTIQDNLKIKEARLKITKEEIKKIDDYEKERKSQEQKIAELQEKLLSIKDISLIINFLTSNSAASQLEFDLLKTDAMLEHETFWELPITVQLKCDYLTLGRYIREVENSTRLLELKGLRLSTASSEDENISVEIEAVAYLAK